MAVPFLDLKAQYGPIRDKIDAAVRQVFDNTAFILGDRVADFESRFARRTGRRYCVGVNSGTSALHLALIAAGVGPGDEVITTPHTWISTSWAVAYCGARPVFADVDPATGNLDPARVEKLITDRTRAVLPVDLYGQPADLETLESIADAAGIPLIEDAAQAHGASIGDRPAGAFGLAACFSFYPGKNLGAAGEGGAVVTDDEQLADRVRRLRDHAQEGRHHHTEIGFNYRMEGLQGAVLGVKLPHLDAWTEARTLAAGRYAELLADVEGVRVPQPVEGSTSAWHLYVVRVEDRDRVLEALRERGIGAGVHYPTPIHLQPAFADLGHRPGSLPHAEAFAASCLSLPMFPEITPAQQEEVVSALGQVVTEASA